MQTITLLIALICVSYVLATPPPPCCTLYTGESCCMSSCACWSNGGGAGKRDVVTTIKYKKELPCKFDCNMFGRISTSAPLFESCSNPIISYTGDYFKNLTSGNIEYRCFGPNSWKNFASSPGKLAKVIQMCQNQGCIKSSTDLHYNATTMPTWSDLVATTTLPMYFWYGQYKTVLPKLGLVRCPTGLTDPEVGTYDSCPTTPLTEFFSAISVMQTQSDSQTTCTGEYCDLFLGNDCTLPPLNETCIEDRTQLVLDTEVNTTVSIRVDCVLPSVSIIPSCVVDTNN